MGRAGSAPSSSPWMALNWRNERCPPPSRWRRSAARRCCSSASWRCAAGRRLRDGEAPVLLVGPWDAEGVEAGRAGSRRVLVALDGSALAEQVLAQACRLAQPTTGATGTRPDGQDGADRQNGQGGEV